MEQKVTIMKRRSFFTRLAAVFMGAGVAVSTELNAARETSTITTTNGELKTMWLRYWAPGEFSDEQERKWAQTVVARSREKNPFRMALEKTPCQKASAQSKRALFG
jgi:hypothetical protein